MGQHREVRTIPRLQKHKFAPLFRILDDGDYLQAIGEEGAMRARLRLLTAGNSYIVPQCSDIVGIHNVDPSQITLHGGSGSAQRWMIWLRGRGVVHNDENKNGDHRYPRGMNHGNESPESIAAQRIRAIFSVSIRLVRVIVIRAFALLKCHWYGI